MNLNVWYEVKKDLMDYYGYQLRTGDMVKITANTPYGSARRYLAMSVWTDNRLNIGRRLFPTNQEIPAIETALEPLNDEAVTKLEKALLDNRKDQPAQYCGGMCADIQVGSDPEVFVTTKTGKLIPAFEFLKPQNKKQKTSSIWVAEETVPPPYWDGFQAEFQIESSHCHAYVTDHIQDQFERLLKLAQAYSPGAKIDPTPVMVIPRTILAGAAPEHVALGCMPSANAYEMQGEKPADGRTLPFRFAGFHVHHGLTNYKTKTPVRDPATIVKCIDNIAGVMSVSVLEGLENPVRRQYYGLAGEYRTPKHGLEYRVLSSAVLWHPALTHLHLDFVRAGTQLAMAGLSELWEGSPEETIDIINKLDVDQARAALKRNRRLMEGLLARYYGAEEWNDGLKPAVLFDKILMSGISGLIDLDVENNWHLTDGEWVLHTEGEGCMMHKFAAEKFGRTKAARG